MKTKHKTIIAAFKDQERELKSDGGKRDDLQQLKKGSQNFRQRLLLWTFSILIVQRGVSCT
ncbi:hypothetical protein YC2023_041496 [Brassica napus]